MGFKGGTAVCCLAWLGRMGTRWLGSSPSASPFPLPVDPGLSSLWLAVLRTSRLLSLPRLESRSCLQSSRPLRGWDRRPPRDNDRGRRRGERTARLWLVARMLPAPPRPVLIMGSLPREVERPSIVVSSVVLRWVGRGS